MGRPKGARDADYELKRAELLRRMTLLVMQRDAVRPSFRQLAQAAGVSVPTLRYYFGDRPGAISAVLEAYLARGGDRLRTVAAPQASLDASVREFAASLVAGFRAPRQVNLGQVFAVAIAEGLMDSGIGPSTLRFVIDPSVDALRARLDHHVARGEMGACDTRTAALMLLSPLLLAILHQDHMGGADCSPVDLEAAVRDICDAFLRAYSSSGAASRAGSG